MSPDQITCLPYSADTSYDEVIDFHRNFLAEHPDGYVITVRSEVTRALGGKARMLNVIPLESPVRAELHELVLRIQSQRAKELSFAAGIFSVIDFESRAIEETCWIVAGRAKAARMDRAFTRDHFQPREFAKWISVIIDAQIKHG